MRRAGDWSRLQRFEEPALNTNPNIAKSLQIRLGMFGIVAICAVGCSHSRNPFDTASVGQQTFPLANGSRPSELPPPGKVTEEAAGKSQAAVPTQTPATPSIQLASLNQPAAVASGPPAELPEPGATSAI